MIRIDRSLLAGRAGSRQMRRTFGVMLSLIVLAGCAGPLSPSPKPATPTPAPQGVTVLDPPGLIHDFTLTNQANRPMKFSELRGKLVLMTFGYTHCPDICPVNLARFKQVKMLLAASASQVAFVFVSVDGKRDTPQVLAQHLSLFDPEIIGLTGSEADVRVVAKDFAVTFIIENSASQTDYTVTHTASSFLVDRQGMLSRVYAYGLDAEVIVADIQSMLNTD